MSLSFDWDPDKAARNLAKHRITFDEAQTVFNDPLVVESPDLPHSIGEERMIAVGHSYRERLLVVVFTQRGDSVRIISARAATKHERRAYEGGA